MQKKLLAGVAIGLLIFVGAAQAENEATYYPSTGIVNIPKVSVGSDFYEVNMQQGQGLDFSVTTAVPSVSNSSSNIATYNPVTGSVNIPIVNIGVDRYMVDMQQGQGLNFSVTNATRVGSVPRFVSDTCNAISTCNYARYNYSHGSLSSITAYFYVKNIGDAGTIDVTVLAAIAGWPTYTENKRFAVDAGARYMLASIIPVDSTSGSTALFITASSPGFARTNSLGPNYSPTFPAGFYMYIPNGAPSSSLVVE